MPMVHHLAEQEVEPSNAAKLEMEDRKVRQKTIN